MIMKLDITTENNINTIYSNIERDISNIQQKEIKKEDSNTYIDNTLERIDELKIILKELNREMDTLQKIIKDKFGSLNEMTQIGNFYLIPTVVKRKGYEVPDQEYTIIKIKRI